MRQTSEVHLKYHRRVTLTAKKRTGEIPSALFLRHTTLYRCAIYIHNMHHTHRDTSRSIVHILPVFDVVLLRVSPGANVLRARASVNANRRCIHRLIRPEEPTFRLPTAVLANRCIDTRPRALLLDVERVGCARWICSLGSRKGRQAGGQGGRKEGWVPRYARCT